MTATTVDTRRHDMAPPDTGDPMHIEIDRQPLLSALQIVTGATSGPTSTLPILTHVLIATTESGHVTLTGTDLEIGARAEFRAVVVREAGAAALPAKRLMDIARELPTDSRIRLRAVAGDTARMELRSAGSRFAVAALDATDFPAFTHVMPELWVRVGARQLRQMLGQVSPAISRDASRYTLNGVLTEVAGTRLTLVATDGHRLTVTGAAVEWPGSDTSAILPQKAVITAIRALEADVTAELGWGRADGADTPATALLKLPDFLLSARLIEGQFPAWQPVVPRGYTNLLTIERERLAAAIERVAIMADDRSRAITLTLGDTANTLTLDSADATGGGEAREDLAVAYAGTPIVITFNSRYLLDAISAVGEPSLTLELPDDGLRPARVRSAEHDTVHTTIMPIRR